MSQRIPENDRNPFTVRAAQIPPRDPDDDEEDEDEDDAERDDQEPAVIREPDEDE